MEDESRKRRLSLTGPVGNGRLAFRQNATDPRARALTTVWACVLLQAWLQHQAVFQRVISQVAVGFEFHFFHHPGAVGADRFDAE